ncbi:MAG TPA: hypothetical protein VK629_08010 [Steroidobacteraceae bacterium]|nr:hypothetical protein [Steroidobacteraceae bacterium]
MRSFESRRNALEKYLDTDEGNATEVVRHQQGEVYGPIKASAFIA